MWYPKVVSIAIALAIGIVFVWFGALNAFFVGLFLLAGWIIGKFLSGEVDILALLERFAGFLERFAESRGKRHGG